MSIQQNQPQRPWIVRGTTKHWRSGKWRRWFTVGTYATEEAANSSCEKHIAAWRKDGDFYVRHRAAPRVKSRERMPE